MKHGTVSNYTRGKCRCRACKDAMSGYHRQRRYGNGKAEMLARAGGARSLIFAGEIDPLLALSYVVWPTERMERAAA